MATFREAISRLIIGKDALQKIKPDLQALVQQEVQKAADLQALKAKAEAIPIIGSGISQFSQQPRTKPTGISFQALRDFSTYYWTARACITKRQEQLANLGWSIIPMDDEDSSDAAKKQAKDIQNRFALIGGPNKPFRHLLDQIIDDLLTLDAMTLYRVRTNGGDLLYLHPIDASTIRIVTDAAGRTPLPPNVAYEQWVKGQKVADLTTDDVIYGMMNPRTSSPYGLSPLESLVVSVSSALRAESSNLNILQEGNVPEGFLKMPANWTPDQIKAYDDWFNAILAGDMAAQRRIKMIPGGEGDSYIPTKKPSDMEFREFEKWLAVKTCAMFGVSPQSIGLTWDVNKATAQEQTLLVQNESIQPLANFLKEYFDHIIQVDFGFADFQFAFNAPADRNEQQQAEVNMKYIQAGVRTINEVRKKLGDDPIEGGDEHFIMTASGPVLLQEVVTPKEDPQPAPAQMPIPPQQDTPKPEEQQKMDTPLQELRKWQRKVLNDLGKGKGLRPFVANVLDPEVVESINKELNGCDADGVRAVFKRAMEKQTVNVVDAAEHLLNELLSISKHDAKPSVTIGRQP